MKEFIIIMVAIFFLVTSAHGQDNPPYELRPDGWPIPDMQSAEAVKKIDKKLGSVDVLFELFMTPQETMFNKISTGGEIWAFLVDTDGKQPMEYILVRTNKFGNFDLKVPAGEQVPVPEWVKKMGHSSGI